LTRGRSFGYKERLPVKGKKDSRRLEPIKRRT
jgi:hypothetical protein